LLDGNFEKKIHTHELLQKELQVKVTLKEEKLDSGNRGQSGHGGRNYGRGRSCSRYESRLFFVLLACGTLSRRDLKIPKMIANPL
jgi:hypothetical protein